MGFFSRRDTVTYPNFYGKLPQNDTNNLWYRFEAGDTVIVFVHGIFSDSRGCWLYENKDPDKHQYWPELLVGDPDFDSVSIFLGGFYTAFDSGNYDARNASQELFDALSRLIPTPKDSVKHSVMEKKNIIFVCHSTGGIVVRYMLYHRTESFRDKTVGLILIASPSYGAKGADRLKLLADLYNNRLGKQLQWKNSDLLSLDKNFKDLVYEKRIPNLIGAEALENRFIIHYKWLPFFTSTLLVNEDSGGRYFASVKVLRNTDHFSTVKPFSRKHPGYELLADFFNQEFNEVLKNSVDSSVSEYVDELSQKVLILRGDYEASNDEGDISSRKVRREAAPLAAQLANISNKDLGLAHKIEKHEYAAYCYILAASVETDQSVRCENSQKALILSKEALQYIELTKRLASEADSEGKAALEWMVKNQDEDRVKFLVVLAHSINLKAGGDSKFADVRKNLRDINTQYFSDWTTSNMHPDLAWALNKMSEQ